LVAEVLLIVLLLLAILGVVALVLVVFAWNRVEPYYEETLGKAGVEFVQVFSGVVGIGGAFATAAQKSEWLPAAWAGAACVALWKAVQLVGDFRRKGSDLARRQTEKELQAKLEHTESELELRARLQAGLRHAVVRKAARVLKELTGLGNRNGSIKHVRRALTPKNHLENMLFDATVFLRETLDPGERDKYNFRVGLYAAVSGVMRAVTGMSYINHTADPFRAHQNHAQFYRLDASENPAAVVRCVKEKRLLIIPDCVEAERQGEFTYYHDDQRSYLRSMAAGYIGEVCTRDGLVPAAIVIDTDFPCFFRMEDEHTIRSCIDELAARISLETALEALTSEKKQAAPKALPKLKQAGSNPGANPGAKP
jgi:hypothetical protein